MRRKATLRHADTDSGSPVKPAISTSAFAPYTRDAYDALEAQLAVLNSSNVLEFGRQLDEKTVVVASRVTIGFGGKVFNVTVEKIGVSNSYTSISVAFNTCFSSSSQTSTNHVTP